MCSAMSASQSLEQTFMSRHACEMGAVFGIAPPLRTILRYTVTSQNRFPEIFF